MGNNNERGQYLSLVWIILGMLIIPFGLTYYLEGKVSEDFLTRVMLMTIMFFTWMIALMIRGNKRLYWVNMYSYKRVKDMPVELVEDLCEGMFSLFTRYFVVYIVVAILGFVLDYGVAADIVAFTVLIVTLSLHTYVLLGKIEKASKTKED